MTLANSVQTQLPLRSLGAGEINVGFLRNLLVQWGFILQPSCSSKDFFTASLPSGWRLEPSKSEANWFRIIDAKGRKRVHLFFDPEAVEESGLRILPRYEIIQDYKYESDRRLISGFSVRDNATGRIIHTESIIESALDAEPETLNYHKAQCMHNTAEWLTAIFPDWMVWGAYWEDV